MSNYFEERYAPGTDDRVEDYRRHMTRTYGLMAGGLALTFVTALLTYLSDVLLWLTFTPQVSIILLLLEVVTVIAFSAVLPRAKYGVVVGMFFFYTLLTGISLSYIFVLYEMGKMILCFAASSISFAIMAIIGHNTKRDLNVFGRLFFAGVVGLILMSIVSLFLRSSPLEFLISLLGLILFLGISAVDAQRMKRVFMSSSGNNALIKKFAVYFALQMYLDFINIFVYMLRLLGRSRD